MHPPPASPDPPSRRDGRSRAGPLIEPVPLPLVELRGSAHIVCFANPAFCALVQRSRVELVGKPFADIVTNGSACEGLLDRVYQAEARAQPTTSDGATPNSTIWLQAMWPSLEGDRRPVRVIVQLSKLADVTRFTVEMNEALLLGGLRQHELREAAERTEAGLQMEIVERIRIENELLEAKAELRTHAEYLEHVVAARTAQLRAAMGDLEAFSYSLVHDLRAPLRAIQGFTQIVLEMSRDQVGPDAADLLQRVVKASRRMDSLIQDVLSLNQVLLQPITLSAVDVDGLVRALVEEGPELSLPRADVRIEAPLLPMWGHEASLSQCLTNLLGNAVKFVASGEVPRVRVWTEFVPVAGGKPHVRLWVEDHGIGIDPKATGMIFEIFQRLHHSLAYEGSGIGLAIVRKAIERMGGQVGVESTVGTGSRFWLELPQG